MFSISSEKINRETFIGEVENDQAGCIVLFEGWVRNHNEGESVESLEYQVYQELAIKEGQKILDEALDKFNIHTVSCVHREGHLQIGDIAILIAISASHRDDAYRASRYVIDEVKLRVPIWKKEHYTDRETEWLSCTGSAHHVHFSEEEYYQKQSRLVDQEKLKQARALVIGAGGLGCPVLMGLVSAGVGHIEIVDFDKIEITNIHRQALFSPNLVGEKKAVVAKNRMTDLNPNISVISHDTYVDEENILDLIQNMNVVVDCTDNMRTKYLIHDACFKTKTKLVSASIFQYEGQLRTFDPKKKSGCLRCMNDEVPDDSKIGNCNDFGVLGAAVNALGSLQALEVIRLIEKGVNNSLAQTIFFNLSELSQMKLKNQKKENCPCCKGSIEFAHNEYEVSTSLLNLDSVKLVDIRELSDEDLNQFTDKEEQIVFYCHKGNRSRRVVKEMWEKGHKNVLSLKGGACSL